MAPFLCLFHVGIPMTCRQCLLPTFVFSLFMSGVAVAQPLIRLQPVFKSDTLNANGDSVVLSTTAPTGASIGSFGSMKIQTIDSYSGTWELQCSVDGVNFDADNELKLTLVDTTTVVYSVTDEVGIWDVGNASACRSVRVIATAGFAASDTVVVIGATQSGGSSGGGASGGGGGDASADNQATQITSLQLLDNAVSGASFAVTNAGTFTTQITDTVDTAQVTDTGGGSLQVECVLGCEPGTGDGTLLDGVDAGIKATIRDYAGSNPITVEIVDANGDAAEFALADPCQSGTKLFVAISQTTGTQLITGTASNRTYICHIQVGISGTAQNIALVSGTGTVCATSTGPVFGGTTAATGWNLGANGGIPLGGGGYAIGKSDTDADNICMLQSGAGQVSGNLTYVVAPN